MNALPLPELRQRAIALVASEPGIDSAELAAELDCEPQEVHCALDEPVHEGLLVTCSTTKWVAGVPLHLRCYRTSARFAGLAGALAEAAPAAPPAPGVDIDAVHRRPPPPAGGNGLASPATAWLLQMLQAAEAEVREAQAFLFAMYRSGAAVPPGQGATLPLSHTASLLRHLEQVTKENAL